MYGAASGQLPIAQPYDSTGNLIESNEFYHSDMDVNTVPAAGLEGIARAYARIVDEVNRLPLSELRSAGAPSTGSR